MPSSPPASGWTPIDVHDAREVVASTCNAIYAATRGSAFVRKCVAPIRALMLHRLNNVLMFPACDPSLLAGGAAMPDGAAPADVGPAGALLRLGARTTWSGWLPRSDQVAEEDVYICPAGERLAYHYTNECRHLAERHGQVLH
jgi:hypothetical protein